MLYLINNLCSMLYLIKPKFLGGVGRGVSQFPAEGFPGVIAFPEKVDRSVQVLLNEFYTGFGK